MKKKQSKKLNPKKKPGPNTGKKYDKPLSLHGMTFDNVVDIALKKK